MNIKKWMALGLSTMLVFTVCACGNSNKAEAPAEPAAPEYTQEAVVQTAGVNLTAPEGAEQVTYGVVEVGALTIGQVTYTLDGENYVYRARTTELTEMPAEAGEDATVAQLKELLENQQELGKELTGMTGELKAGATTMVGDADAIVAFNNGKDGFICWLDPETGILYSIAMEKGADQTVLTEMAELVYAQ